MRQGFLGTRAASPYAIPLPSPLQCINEQEPRNSAIFPVIDLRGTMRSLVAFICLAQLLSYTPAWSAPPPPPPPPPVRDPNCDDPDVEQAALAAVQYVNSNHRHGYKYTLNQIDKVRVYQRRPLGEVYVLEMDLLETTCHVLDPTPLKNCIVRQVIEHAVEGDCDVSVLKLDNQFVVSNAKCESSPDSAEDVRKVCPNCALLVPLNDTKVLHAVDAALAAFNAQNHSSYFKLLEISRAQIAPLQSSVYVEFVVVPTDCAPKDMADPAACNLLADQYGFCKATLTEKDGGEDVAASCTVFGAAPGPQPDGAGSTVGPTVAAGPTEAARPVVATGPPVVAGPARPPVFPAKPILSHLSHHDLRHSIVGAGSFESASGEHGLAPGPKPGVPGPGLGVPGPGLAAPAIPLCPGRIRYFKV
ncbi:alpha-2-HS-glycoprotein [Trichosurus vulpecula]|uniref:alpha-2-HS-glycoprotein n=1 Tax=Trichosurus vulpecula TaxID=9337 RepID=UPI00186B3E57|nr:alpha-2-HS-glycoprotein [Trichosurus vulpecula]